VQLLFVGDPVEVGAVDLKPTRRPSAATVSLDRPKRNVPSRKTETRRLFLFCGSSAVILMRPGEIRSQNAETRMQNGGRKC
jgi:hypothetical protein